MARGAKSIWLSTFIYLFGLYRIGLLGICGGERYRFKNACSRTNNIHASKLLFRDMEHALEMVPVGDIGLLENGFGGGLGAGGVVGDQLLGFGTKLQVGEDNVAAFTQESACECEVDAWNKFVQ